MNISNLLIIVGIVLISFGVLWKIGFKIGNLPGDIKIEKGNTSFYFPVTTSILISIVLTIVFMLYSHFAK